MNQMKKNKESTGVLKALLTIMVLVIFVILGVVQLTPPAPQGPAVPAGQFSAAQAFKYLQTIAQKPHPLHSKEKEKVRDYILQELRSMGLETEVQKSHMKDARGKRDWNLENILTRIKGTASSGVLVVVAHYDSVPMGPGASDNGAAVASALVSLHQLKSMPPLKNDLVVLFSDGEEYGLLGAYKFMEEHRWHNEVSMVLNYEARGHKGPSLMFQTNDQNGWVIAEFAKAAPYPRAYSWAFEVYKHMPNDTDFTVFNRKGITGLNFAYLAGWKYYHTANDNLKNISHSSLQHHGENMLPLISHFGNLDLKHTKAGNLVYFSIFNWLVYYPGTIAFLLMIVAGLGFIGILYWGLKIHKIKITRVLGGFLLFLLVIAISAAMLFWAGKSIHASQPDFFPGYYTSALSFLALGLFSLLYFLFLKRFALAELFAGVLILFFILTLATVFLAPGGSYMFNWPLLLGVVALTFLLKRKTPGWGTFVMQGLLILPTYLLLVPSICLTVDALGIGFAFAAANLFIILMAGISLPLISNILKPFRWWFPLFFMVLGVGMLIIGR